MEGAASPWADPRGGPALGVSRSRVLQVLQDAGEPLGSADVASRTGLHPNTARFHLDALVAAGLVARTVEQRDVPGRPRALYESLVEEPAAGRRSYRLLAEILTRDLTSRSRNPGGAAVAAGEAWGRSLATRPASPARVSNATATQLLTGVLDEVGFAPQTSGTPRARQILLHHCPFRELAQEHRNVVCGVHLGLMRGVLAELGSTLDADRLEPFVEPSLCVASLAKRQ